MTRRSLWTRFVVAAVLSIALALIVAAAGLIALFERHVERRIAAELIAQLHQLAAAAQVQPDGSLDIVPEPADPRFHRPLSGLYWQIDDETGPEPVIGLLRSRSLWDTQLQLPPDRLDPGTVHAHDLPGPGGQRLIVRERRILLDAGGATRKLRLVIAVDRRDLRDARNAFATDMLPYLVLIALVLGVANLIQIRAGLAPLEAVRRGVGAIRSGRQQRLADDYPDEVMPLVTEVNALLGANEQAVERARAWTADLAHGLKTPLAALAAEAARLRDGGNPALAAELEELADVMRRRVDRELIRARVRSGAGARQARADVRDAIERVLRTLRRTPDGERVDWTVSAPARAEVALMPEDLLELLGNLLENAAKWARHRIGVTVAAGTAVEIRIEDDGPGIPPALLPRLGERGLRLDERKEGSGLGLAIARDVIEAYAGHIDFTAADSGGLAVKLRLPAVQP